MSDQTEEFTFESFKEYFIQISKDEFGACNGFTGQINMCNNTNEMRRVLCSYADEIFDTLGGEHWELENKIEELESQVECLENTIEDIEEKYPTMFDRMKHETYLEHVDKYLPWEFEELLKNGHLLLGKSK